MFECIRYFKTSDGNLFKYYDVKKALQHELEINVNVKGFKLFAINYDKDEPYQEIDRDFNNLTSLANTIWNNLRCDEIRCIYISNEDAFNFINNLVRLLNDEEYKAIVIKNTCEITYNGRGLYKYSYTAFTPLQYYIDDYIKDINTLKGILNRDVRQESWLTRCEDRLDELLEIKTNLNRFF